MPRAMADQSSARKSSRSKKRSSCQTARTMKAVKLTSIRADCAEAQIISDEPQMNAAKGPPIFHISQSRNTKAISDGRTKAQVE